MGVTPTALSVLARPPTFAFHKMVPADCDHKTKGRYLDHFVALSSMTWKQIRHDKREGNGLELIRVTQFSAKVQKAVPPDVPHRSVGRVSKKMRFAGYAVEGVLYVIVLDPNHDAY